LVRDVDLHNRVEILCRDGGDEAVFEGPYVRPRIRLGRRAEHQSQQRHDDRSADKAREQRFHR